MEVSIDWESPRSFVLSEEKVKAVWSLLKDRIGDVSASARCADEVTRHFKTVKDLLSYDNNPTRRILRLDLDARPEQPGKSATIRFQKSGVDISLHGREDAVVRLNGDLKDFLDGIVTRFDRLARYNFVGLGFMCGVLVLLSLVLLVGVGAIVIPSDPHAPWPTSAVLMLGTMFASFVAGVVCDKFRQRLFPVATFLIGHEKGRHETRERWQWALVSSFVLAILGLPFSLLVKFLLR